MEQRLKRSLCFLFSFFIYRLLRLWIKTWCTTGHWAGWGSIGSLAGFFSLFSEHCDLIFFFASHANVTQHNRAAGKGNVHFSGKKCSTYKSGCKGWHRRPSDDWARCAVSQNPLGSAVPASSNGVLLKINCFLSILKQSTYQAVLRCHWQRREMEGNWFSSWCNVGQSCQKVN